ncbi:MAG: glycerol-3-phosphate ABC transporter ATP-binding protein [Spirochaetes bacterium GWD1_61_31]|nr:MAG: glycerol-3-phosphate ABC transporter ATP-binding protein [Spirochaetes bacterium GWB1_60_80]OHD32936.1 MAG: glycerol-3-phosphate ABC transporter ATP-binding protein [Spirochaetes bacterium GWC1_61_12]OHD38678.1 MAG: glycerol-3-phosphate ABC transporter ATP-binding protein [Spirochaetes bacterium GWD1_61_31]OHD43213.1 MAG: glycerol-3-phosphate ABC transporter ATP-binding protein [Spirochaetes bacterium GWE1_60_18]OHD58775.1 MAG: glycerol-3-phosphate ABC transporter ATP-binding protein [S
MGSITLKSVCKVYDGKVKAVEDVNLEIADGEFVVFVGPSGCGKSTTLRMIAGLEDVSGGNILIDDDDVTEMLPGDRDIAMVFQNYALYPHMNVFQNMAFSLTIRRTNKKEIEARVMEAARILDLEPLLQRKPKQLSGGQRQRVAVGRAIVRKPKVFLFDEPLSNLDAKLRVQMRAELAALHKKLGATMLYVTHDQVEAMTMGDRIVIMKDGLVQQVGTPAELYTHPANQFVAGFIGSPPMNFAEAAVVLVDSQKFLQAEGQRLAYAGVFKAGQQLVWGIRPENLKIVREATASTVQAKIVLVEPLGSEKHVYCRLGAVEVVARAEMSFWGEIGDTVFLHPDMEEAHFFDTATGQALY